MTFHQATAPTAAQLDALRRSFRGEIVTPDASGYVDARRVWNAVFDRRPALVARAAAAALLGQLDVAGQAHGLVCPVGVVGHTGVAGLTLGGGFGRLQRHFGLPIHDLRAVEPV